jgi:hypothetical protein
MKNSPQKRANCCYQRSFNYGFFLPWIVGLGGLGVAPAWGQSAEVLSPADPPEKPPVCITAPHTVVVSALYKVEEPKAPGEPRPTALVSYGEVTNLVSGSGVLTGKPGTLTQYVAGDYSVRRFDFQDPSLNGAMSVNFGPWFPVIGYEQERSQNLQLQSFYFDPNNHLDLVAEILVRESQQKRICRD